MRVLTVNAGSSSLKLRVLDGDSVVASHDVQRWDGEREPIAEFIDEHGADAVGHRVVHGGTEVTEPVVVDDKVLEYLDSLTDLAPLQDRKSVV